MKSKVKIEKRNLKKNKPSITMMSNAEMVKGQGVASAYREQLTLVQEVLGGKYQINVNQSKYGEITHYHTVEPQLYLHALLGKNKTCRVGYVHFIPETLEGSIKLAPAFQDIFCQYVLRYYRLMDILVTVNPLFIDKLVALGFDRQTIRYIPNYVSADRFYRLPLEEKQAIRRQYQLDERAFVVLGVGQVQTRKGVLDFIEVAKSCPAMTFVWAGGFSFGKITDGYQELKKVMENPPANVRFLGIVERSEMNQIYNMADVMFLPSYSELFPMTLLESMNVSLPMVLRDLDLYQSILFDYYLKADDNQGFVDHLHHLAENRATYDEWAKASYKGHLFYSKENVGQLWETFYDSLLVSK